MPDLILDELVRHRDMQLEIEVYLASGPILRGRCVSVHRGIATLHAGPVDAPSVTYVRVEHVVAITLPPGAARRGLTPPRGTTPPRNAGDDVVTPITPLTMEAVRAAMSIPSVEIQREPSPAITIAMPAVVEPPPFACDISAAFAAMDRAAGSSVSIPAPDPIAEFVASEYDVVTPPEPIAPVEAPTYLPERKQDPHDFDAVTFAMRPEAKIEAKIEAKKTPRPRNRTPAPSRVDLMRQANTHSEMLSTVFGRRVDFAIAAPLDDDSRRAISHTLPLASDVLCALIGDVHHNAALDRVAQVELVAGDPEVRIDGARLVIRCPVVDRYTAAALRAAIERA